MKRLIVAMALVATVAIPLHAYAQEQPALSCTTVVPSGSGLQLVGKLRVGKGPLGITVDGRVANVSNQPHSGLITITLFDDAANIVGVYRGAVTSVAANDEVTYTAFGTDMPESWAATEAKVSQL